MVKGPSIPCSCPNAAAPKMPPNHPALLIPFTLTQDKVIHDHVKQFIINLQSQIIIFLKDNVQLPLWQSPLNLDAATRRHLTGLKIPTISSSSQVPLLLLHNLGQPSHNTQLAERVDGLFSLELG